MATKNVVTTQTTDIQVIQPQEIQEIQSWIMVVKNQQDYDVAIHRIATLRSMEDKIREYWKPQIDSAYKTHKELCKRRDEMLKPILNVKIKIQESINKYTASRKAIESKKTENNIQTIIQEKKVVEVVNLAELVAAVAAGRLPSDVVLPNMKKLQEIAELTNDIPGCTVRVEKQTIVKRV